MKNIRRKKPLKTKKKKKNHKKENKKIDWFTLFPLAYFDPNSKTTGEKEVQTHEFWFALLEHFHAYSLLGDPENAIA